MPVDARSCATNSNAKGAVGSLRNRRRLFRLDKTSGVTSKSLEPYAKHLKVTYLAGERCSANDECKEDLERYIRLCFALKRLKNSRRR